MYKILNGLLPDKLKQHFKYVSEVSTREMRHSQGLNLYISKPRLELSKKSFLYDGAMLWNSLPDHVKKASNLEHFKTLLNGIII